MASKRILKSLTIEEKFKLIKEIESGKKNKEVAIKYGIATSTVSTIFKNKELIITSFESGATSGQNKRRKKLTFENVDKAVFAWFTAARNQNLTISGALLKEKAREFAKRFGDQNFKASSGWLDKWKRRHYVSPKKVYGKNDDNCEKWTPNILPNLLEKYSECDIFNADETLDFKIEMESDNEGSVDDTIQQPSNNEVRDCFRTLKLYLQTNETTTDDHYKALNKLKSHFSENSKRNVGFQSLITDYFIPF